MPTGTIPKRLSDVQPKMLRAELRPEAKASLKKLEDLRPVIGKLVERALELAHLTKQEASYLMLYRDAGSVSRWCAGTERPAFDKLFTLDGFIVAYVLAIAEHNENCSVETTVTIKRRSA